MSTEVTLIVSVWLKHDDVAAFEAFERRVATWVLTERGHARSTRERQ